MTRIRYKARPTWHETGLVDRSSGRAYCVAESPAAVLLRLKGTRTVVSLPWNVAYIRAAFLAADAKRVAKKTHSIKRGVIGGVR